MVFNLTRRQLYKNFKLVYKIGKISYFSIFPSIIFMTALISNLDAISYYSLIAKTLYILYLHFIKN